MLWIFMLLLVVWIFLTHSCSRLQQTDIVQYHYIEFSNVDILNEFKGVSPLLWWMDYIS